MGLEIRNYAWKALFYALLLEVLLVGAIVFWPSFEEHIGALRDFLPIAEGQKLFDAIEEGGVASYVHLQQFFKGCNTLGTAAGVLFAMNAVAGEAHRGTLELWLSRPISRRALLLERWILGALALVLPVFATTLSIPPLLERIGESMDAGPLLLCAAHESLFLLALYSLAFLWSCASSKPTQIAFGMLGFTVFEFSIYLIKDATHWSIFRLVDVEVFARISAARALDPVLTGALAAVVVVALVASDRVFARRF